GPAREIIRQRVRGPALGLKIASIVWLCSGVGWATISPDLSHFFIASLNLAQGVLVFLCAQQMRELRRYQRAILGCILVMLPCYSPAVVLGLAIGLWGLVVLLRPEVRAAFTS